MYHLTCTSICCSQPFQPNKSSSGWQPYLKCRRAFHIIYISIHASLFCHATIQSSARNLAHASLETAVIEQSDSTHLAAVKSRGGLSFAEPRAKSPTNTCKGRSILGWEEEWRKGEENWLSSRERRIRIIMTSVRVRLCVRREAGRRGRACSHADIIYMQHHERAHLGRRTDGRTEEEGKSTKPSPSPLAQKGVRIIRVSRVRPGKDP